MSIFWSLAVHQANNPGTKKGKNSASTTSTTVASAPSVSPATTSPNQKKSTLINNEKDTIEYKVIFDDTGLKGMKQSKCSKCKDLGIYSPGIRILTGLVFIAAELFHEPTNPQFEPFCDINYGYTTTASNPTDDHINHKNNNDISGSRLNKTINMQVPPTTIPSGKILHSELGSTLYVTWLLISKGLPQLVGIMFRLYVIPKFSKGKEE